MAFRLQFSLLRCIMGFDVDDEANADFKSKVEAEIASEVEFEDASKAFIHTFKQHISSSSIRKENVLSFLSAYRKLKTMKGKFPSELKKCICEEKWLRTRLGDYILPYEC
ncbi:hypothetical protein L6452_27644 [Arctium lappa]|uniref:Uncharacterized protein n=1 Tax=Arctium lappa TaxID=4217 RepID=A0ACB8ZXJ9_ARCLA|nr:hypothetical protein L6452_27644 [Arctium lappa]